MAEDTTEAADGAKPLNQMYYDAVEALKASGMSNADAIRTVATQYGKNENAVRGGIHQYKTRRANGSGPAARSRRTTSSLSYDDYIASARAALEAARDMIDRELAEAKATLDAAQAHYDNVQAGTNARQADIEKKLAALS